MHGKRGNGTRKRAATPIYVSPNQLSLVGYETPFRQTLTRENRWVKLSEVIPWDKIVSHYDQQFKSTEGRPPISGRVIIGALIIKHILNISDRETILQIRENMFMQYFLGYSTFTNEEPFSPALFVAIRERMSLEIINAINEIIVAHHAELNQQDEPDDHNSEHNGGEKENTLVSEEVSDEQSQDDVTRSSLPVNTGRLLVDATVAPQNITYPTDLKLLNASRLKSEELIDKLYNPNVHGDEKVRTYRNIARKDFLKTAQKKSKTHKELYKANGSQLRYLRRNLGHICKLMEAYKCQATRIPLKERDFEYLRVITQVYEQQNQMHQSKTRSIENRIVNIHQRYVRPIVRGKEGKKVEFGSKLHISLVNGFTFIDNLSWDNFNEGIHLMSSIEMYKKRFGCYPAEVLADKIYCNRENRRQLKELNIDLRAKPLGRPRQQALSNQVSPGERNPVEGKFGQAKVGYGLDNIRAKLKSTSESWIATITLVLNLVNLTRLTPHGLYMLLIEIYTKFSLRKNIYSAEFLSRP